MNIRRFVLIALTILIATVAFIGVGQALDGRQHQPMVQANLANVRDFTPAPTRDSPNYAVDGDVLYAGKTGAWLSVNTPTGVVVNTVAQDSRLADVVYIGAANALTLYRSMDGGQNWLRIPVSEQVGAVTDIAIDSVNRMVYVGTDNAGLFRLQEAGTSLIANGRLNLDEPVLQVALDKSGAGLIFVRTAWNLYRSENGGLTWARVDTLLSIPTALAITDTTPTTVYVGTADRGILTSSDGVIWQMANAGLGLTPGNRLSVDALAVDLIQPQVVYVSTSLLFGNIQVHAVSQGVAMSLDSAQSWTNLAPALDGNVAVVDLLPVSGQSGVVFVLAANSRTPRALGAAAAPAVMANAEPVSASMVVAQPAESVATNWLAWIVASLAALAFVFAAGYDIFANRGRKPNVGKTGGALAAVQVNYKRITPL